MAMTEVSKEYGTALFMLACENNKKDEYARELSLIEKMFCENAEYPEFLSSPSIPLSERISAIDNAFSDSLCEEVISFLKLLCEKGRMNCFSDSVAEYNELLVASNKITNAKITSAIELSCDEKKKIIEKLEKMLNTAIEPEYVTDGSIIGGVIIEADGKIFDGSLRTRLRDVKEVMNR